MFDEGWDDVDAPMPPAHAFEGAGLNTFATPDHDGRNQLEDLMLEYEKLTTKPVPARPEHHPAPAPVQAQPHPPCVELGFIADYQPSAEAEPFACKLGGQPYWLEPLRLPAQERLVCARCGKHMRLLLQLYCPRPELPCAFHRSLLLFCCGGQCLSSDAGWCVLRCNLPEETSVFDEGYVPTLPQPAQRDDIRRLPERRIEIDVEGHWQSLVDQDGAESSAAREALLRFEARVRAMVCGHGEKAC